VLKRIWDGFLFGTGFTLALLLIIVLITPRLMPVSFSPGPRPATMEPHEISPAAIAEGQSFHELPMEEQIKRASVIALARYEPGEDGKMKAVIREFLKMAPDTVIHYKVGDEFASGSFYPSPERHYGDGMVIFFVGSPASMRLSMTYSGDRIHGLGDIPVELFRKKCEAGNG
jgi:hypothetical protein